MYRCVPITTEGWKFLMCQLEIRRVVPCGMGEWRGTMWDTYYLRHSREGTYTSKFLFILQFTGSLNPVYWLPDSKGVSAPVYFATLFAIEAILRKLVPEYSRTNFLCHWRHESSPENIHASKWTMGKYYSKYFPIRFVLRRFRKVQCG